MKMDHGKELPQRKRLRLKNVDYSTPGAYFITICTHNRKCMLSRVVGVIHESPLRGRSVISKVIGYVKMNASKEIHGKYDDAVIWQRGFHDHIIRDRRDYEKIAKYIYENPIRWQYDCFFAEE